MTQKKDVIEVEGQVEEALANMRFRVKLKDERLIFCHLSGKLRLHHIKIVPGDKVKVEISNYDPAKGRITYRL